MKQFHLSIGVKSLDESANFFKDVLGAKVTYREKDNGANVELLGSQIFLKSSPSITANLPDFHFGFNLSIDEFENLSKRIISEHSDTVTMKPKVIDGGTPRERKKMYLKSPTGYAIELKGYK